VRYLLFVGLDRFYSCRFEPPPATVVYGAGTVLDCCPSARARLIRPGTPLAEAKTILRGEGRFVEFRETDYTADRDRWLDVCLLYSSRVEHETPASAWIDLSRHPTPLEIAGRLLADVWHSNALPVRAAIAPARWVAKIAARPCDPAALSLGISDVPLIEDVPAFLAQLPTKMLTPVAVDHRMRLEFLGYRRIAEAQTAPLHLLCNQFGKDGLLIHQAAHGRLGDPIRPNYPYQAIEGIRTFEGCCADRLTLTNAMGEIADDLSAALRNLDLLAGSTETVMELETGLMLRRVRRLPRPSDSLALSLQHQLAQTNITTPVASLRVTVPDLRPVPAVQHSLGGADRIAAERAAESSVRGLCAMYGDSAVRPANKIELPRRNKVLRAWRDANGWR
jgi:DNA polymerase IV (DinB-like DNA polymerase)